MALHQPDPTERRFTCKYPPGVALMRLPVMAFVSDPARNGPPFSPAEHWACLALGATALDFEVKENNEAVVDLLVKAGATGNPKQIRLGIDMRRAACRGFKSREGDGYPYFPGNAGGDGAPTIEEVFKRGGDVNAPDPAGYTPLMFTANLGLVDNVKTLLAHGADPSLKTYPMIGLKGGTTALSLAEVDATFARADRKKVVELLKAHQAKE